MKETGELSSQDAAEIAEEVHDMKKKGQKINAERIIRNLRKKIYFSFLSLFFMPRVFLALFCDWFLKYTFRPR